MFDRSRLGDGHFCHQRTRLHHFPAPPARKDPKLLFGQGPVFLLHTFCRHPADHRQEEHEDAKLLLEEQPILREAHPGVRQVCDQKEAGQQPGHLDQLH